MKTQQGTWAGGSRRMAEIRALMALELGVSVEEISFFDMFIETHMAEIEDGSKRWVKPHYKTIVEKYKTELIKKFGPDENNWPKDVCVEGWEIAAKPRKKNKNRVLVLLLTLIQLKKVLRR